LRLASRKFDPVRISAKTTKLWIAGSGATYFTT
jgi:hypothetical protein